MSGVVSDEVTLRDVGKQHVIRTGKGQEDLVGRRSTSWTMDDLRLGGLQEVAVLHQKVDILDGKFDREDAANVRRIICETMMGAIEPQKRGVADPVADAAVE